MTNLLSMWDSERFDEPRPLVSSWYTDKILRDDPYSVRREDEAVPSTTLGASSSRPGPATDKPERSAAAAPLWA